MAKLKVQFHMHTKQDPIDGIAHSEHEAIDRAAKLGYDVLAITCHNVVIFNDSLKKYAAEKRILLIPAIEKSILKKHVLILNADIKTQNIKTFDDLRTYKKLKPDCFIIAAHPYYPASIALKKHLEKNIDLFDAIEYSWFHSKCMNKYNNKAVKTAEKHNLPMIATSDNHLLRFFDQGYTFVDAKEKTTEAIFKAMREKKIDIVSHDLKWWQLPLIYCEMTIRQLAKAVLLK